LEILCEKFMPKKQKKFITFLCCAAFPASICLLVFADSYQEQGDMLLEFTHTTLQRASFEWVTNFLSFPLIFNIVASPGEVPLRLAFSCSYFIYCKSFFLQVSLLPTPWERDWLSQPPNIVWLGLSLISLFVILLPYLSLGQGCVARIVLIIV
jgi:hypothetical protein